jgi:hypothetical protein
MMGNIYIANWFVRDTILKQKLFPLLLIVVLLAACQGAASPTNTPAVIEDTTDTVEVSAVPVAESSGSSNPTIEVTGTVTASVEADNFYVAPVKNEDEAIIATMLYLNQADTHVVFIRFPLNAAPGTFPISSGYTDTFDGTTATGNYINQSTDPAGQFAANGGTLTITASSPSYSGSYTFTAQDAQTGLTVTVSGTFTDIQP